MHHSTLNMLIMHSLIGQQKIQSRRLTYMSLLNAVSHARICIDQEEEDATRGQTAHGLVEGLYSARKALQFHNLALPLRSLVPRGAALLVAGVGLPENPWFESPGCLGHGK